MSDAADYRRYLHPQTLARVGALELRARFIVEGLMTGQHRSPYQGSSVEFAQHRPYVPGDDVRHVDWKVFGRTDRIYIKQFQEETNLPLVLVCDASESMSFGSVKSDDGKTIWTKYDHATAVAAALSHLAIQQQDAVGLAIFDQQMNRFFKPSNSPSQWRLVINEMQAMPRWNKTGIGKVLDQLNEKVQRRSVIVLLSDLFDDATAIAKGLRKLRHRKHDVIVVQLLDPQEADFPFNDVTLFKGLEEAGELLTEPRALRQGYLDELAAHAEAIKNACRSMHVDYSLFRTDEPLDVVLSQFLANRLASMK